jgi:hypothetical protein
LFRLTPEEAAAAAGTPNTRHLPLRNRGWPCFRPSCTANAPSR